MLKAAGIGQRTASAFTDRVLLTEARNRARRELALLVPSDISLLSCTSPQYPPALLSIADPPVLLYCRGSLSCLEHTALAIIGSRSATEYGKRVSAKLATQLAALGITVVSGAAYGIDASAHRGALDAGGATVAVLGCGIDVVYPRPHSGLYQEIVDSGLLLSEYPLGTPPEGFRFPARNRIISGLVRGVIVVEATRKSGSLITAALAVEQGRDVFAVPGRIDSPKSAGTHCLIQQGACLVQSVDDILAEIAWHSTGSRDTAGTEPLNAASAPSSEEKVLLDTLEPYPMDIDSLIRKTGLAAVEIHALLLQLELKGLIRHLPGQQYERVVFD